MCFLPRYLPQSWTRSRPPFQDPTCPSLNSSTAGTSGRTCVCSASPRKSPPPPPRSVINSQVVSFSAVSRFLRCFPAAHPFVSVSFLPLDSSLTASVTVTAPSEVTSEAPPPVSTGCTCCQCAQEAAPGCCSGRPWTGAAGVAFCSSP